MIRTLVVDDDYRVARAHALSIERIDGFVCVGEAHSCAETRAIVPDVLPDLLLLDLYLPDGNGLDLASELKAMALAQQPDYMAITAARDVESVRRAMQSGAIHYLVKPFGFTQLRDKLGAYRRLRAGLDTVDVADQASVDALYDALRGPPATPSLSPTMARVFNEVKGADTALTAVDVAQRLGVSRPTAQRYLARLVERGILELALNYGSSGRPEHCYRLRGTPRT